MLDKYDYVIINGTFNNNTGNNWYWMKEILINLFKHTKIKLSFNNLSKYVDYYDKNGKRMSVMSEDGKNVYFCDPKYSVCYPTGLPIEQYLLAFYLPSDNLEKLGKNNKTGCDNYKYVTQKTFKVVGTDPYYVEDITYCIIDEELTSFTMRDAFIEKDGSRSDYLTNHYEVKEFGIDADIEQDVFTLLYPMGKEPSRD